MRVETLKATSKEKDTMKSDRSRSEETGRHHGLCCSVREKGKGSDVARAWKELSNRLC